MNFMMVTPPLRVDFVNERRDFRRFYGLGVLFLGTYHDSSFIRDWDLRSVNIC